MIPINNQNQVLGWSHWEGNGTQPEKLRVFGANVRRERDCVLSFCLTIITEMDLNCGSIVSVFYQKGFDVKGKNLLWVGYPNS